MDNILRLKNKIKNHIEEFKNNDNLIEKKILDIINKYLFEKCSHEWETDWIDIDCEKSISIKYCKKCELDFHSKS